MKSIISLAKIAPLLLAAAFQLTSCNLFDFREPYDEDFVPGESLEAKSLEIGLEGGTLSMTDGTSIVVPAEGVLETFTLHVSKINPKYLFSETNSMVYDIEFTSAPLFLEINFKMKKGLKEENISIVSFNPDETLDEISGYGPDFIYDPETGFATTYIFFETIPGKSKQLKGLKHELLFTRWVVEWDENVEGKVEGMCIDLPYYMQPGQTCVTTCAVMLTKAYTPYKDRKNEYEIHDYLKKLGIEKPDGVGSYSFLHSLHSIFHGFTGAGVTTEGYFLRSLLQSKIIEELDKGHPVIMNMDYPGEGRHAILIAGYERIISGSQKTTYNFIYHNPSLSENMYQKSGFDWLMSTKSWWVAYQILFPTDQVHPKRSLQTIGMPLNEDGFIKFMISGKKYSINLDYDKNSETGYNWFDAKKQVYSSIPDSATSLDLSLPVWNADQKNAKDVKIRTLIIKKGVTEAVFLEDINLTLPVGKHPYWFNKSIPVGDFVQKDGDKKYTILVQIWSNYDEYLDGFSAEVNIEPTREKKFTVGIVALDPEGAPISKDGKPGVEYGFEADYDGLPANVSSLLFKWDFGDGTSMQQSDTKGQKHTFNTTGSFTIKAEVWDNLKNVKLGEDVATATIKGDILIFTTTGCGAKVRIKYNDLKRNTTGITDFRSTGGIISWEGTSFSGNFSMSSEDTEFKQTVLMEYNGSVSQDGKTLVSFNGSLKDEAKFKSDGKLYWLEEYAFTINNLKFPLDQFGNPTLVIDLQGSEYASNVSVSKYTYKRYNKSNHDFLQDHRELNSIDPQNNWIRVSFGL